MKPILRAETISKRYNLGTRAQAPYRTLREEVSRLVSARFRNTRPSQTRKASAIQAFWALQNVTFDVMPGDILGIIGRNGAGKSTLLKILSQITAPTSGSVNIYGRVGSLLEVGTGFHPELTGRENIYLNGAILGMSRREIGKRFDAIVQFSELNAFIDTPVKRYSSGMYTRLAFAVASELTTEILLVDEILSVGDAQFQKKCLGRIGYLAKQGRTILFVSHNMVAIQALCTRGMWLDKGTVAAKGTISAVVSAYLNAHSENVAEHDWSASSSAPGNAHIRMQSARLLPPNDTSITTLDVGTPFCLVFEYWNLNTSVRLNLSLSVYNSDNVCVFVSTSVGETNWDGKKFGAGLFRSVCRIPARLLNDGTYRVSVLFVKDTTSVVFEASEILAFEVHDDLTGRGDWHGKWQGIVRPSLQWHTDMLERSVHDESNTLKH